MALCAIHVYRMGGDPVADLELPSNTSILDFHLIVLNELPEVVQVEEVQRVLQLVHGQSVFYSNDQATLEARGLGHGAVVHVVMMGLTINVFRMGGDLLARLLVPPDTTVSNLHRRVLARLPEVDRAVLFKLVHGQSLLYSIDQDTLEARGLEAGAIVHVVILLNLRLLNAEGRIGVDLLNRIYGRAQNLVRVAPRVARARAEAQRQFHENLLGMFRCLGSENPEERENEALLAMLPQELAHFQQRVMKDLRAREGEAREARAERLKRLWPVLDGLLSQLWEGEMLARQEAQRARGQDVEFWRETDETLLTWYQDLMALLADA